MIMLRNECYKSYCFKSFENTDKGVNTSVQIPSCIITLDR